MTDHGAEAVRRGLASRLHVITRPSPDGVDRLASIVSAAIDGGAGVVQYRRKDVQAGTMVDEVRRLLEVCHPRGVPLIVNDRLDVALAAGADGVHLGAGDLPWRTARNLAPPPFVIGVTAATEPRIAEAIDAGADYAGAGPARASSTKHDTGPRRTPSDYEALAAACARREGSPLPLVAVGGIETGAAAELIAAGCHAVAVSAAIVAAKDPESATRALIDEIANALPRGAS